MKILAYLCVFAFVGLVVQLTNAQPYNSISSGSWTTGATWVGGTFPALGNPGGITTNNTHTITIESDVFLNSPLNVAGGTTIVVTSGSSLTIHGSMAFQNNSIVLVEEGATLLINGNVTNNNNSNDITINGTIVINGNFTGGSGSEIIGTGAFEITGSITTTGTGTVFGSTDDCTANCSINQSTTPLPITLSAFTVSITPQGMRIAWSTESERDNDFFQVFHSTNGIDWEIIATVLGAGTSSTTSNYTALHQTAQPGLNYYKLVQQDFDGTRESFPPIAIQSKSPRTLVGRFNMSGQEVPEGYNGLVIEQYSDGSVEKRMNPY